MEKKILGLLFTKGISLELWLDRGLFFREKLIYEEYLKRGIYTNIYWFTYGKNDSAIYHELVEKKQLDKRIIVVPMPSIFEGYHRELLYSVLLPVIQRRYIEKIDFFKTNQMQGAWTAEIIRVLFNIPYLLRTGYTHSSYLYNCYLEEQESKNRKKLYKQYKKYSFIEKRMYQKCNVASVSSLHDQKYICEKYNVEPEKVYVVTNYIDCTLFKKKNVIVYEDRVVFVGRLNHVKNLKNTMLGVSKAGLGLDIYGDGEDKEMLMQFATDSKLNVSFKGKVSNDSLPDILNQYRYYILASEHEGMPKTLLEAMACGLICLGTKVSGIEEVINNQVNGFLIPDTSERSIYDTLNIAIKYGEKEKMSRIASDFALQNYSIEMVINKEQNIVSKILEEEV